MTTRKEREEEIKFGRRVYAHEPKGGSSRLFPSYGGMSSRAKAEKFARGTPEAMIKIGRASIKSLKHLTEAARYISRNGKLDSEDQDGCVISNTDTLDATMEDWMEKDRAEREKNPSRHRHSAAQRIIVSTPTGTDPEALKKAVREFAQTELRDRGFEYIWTIHLDTDNPHAHILVRSVGKDGHRLHYSLREVKALRERWCVVAEKYGIDLNATSRAVRGKTRRAKPIERVKQEQRGSQHIYEKYRIEELVKVLKSGGEFTDYENEVMKKARATRVEIRQNAADYVKELRDSGNPDDIKLAELIAEKMNNLPPVESAQEERLRKARDKIRRKRQKRTAAEKARAEAAKEAIRRRKKAEQEGKKRYR
ncbi:MAG: relaxase/mobilization nuclease domain-containing protein [Succinivibrionaceae bacterium]|nr:relaxase/mobilization nuclease domain-containing protein [Succinivibrionaceae bacterium]